MLFAVHRCPLARSSCKRRPSVGERFDLGPLKPKSENLRKVKAG